MYRLILLFFILIGIPLYCADSLPDALEAARGKGDFQQVRLLSRQMESLLAAEEDPVVRTLYNRALWVQRISLIGSGFFDYNISALKADGDDIWFGSRSGDIGRYSLSERKWLILQEGSPSLAIRSVNAIETDRRRVWILSYGSLMVFDKRTGEPYLTDLPDHRNYRGMQSLTLLGRGVLVGTQASGLRRILPAEETVLSLPELRNVSFFRQVNPELLFAGTEENGLFLLDNSFHIRECTDNNRRTGAVRSLLDYRGGFLGGSYGNGLFVLRDVNDTYEYEKLPIIAKWITDGVETEKGYCFSTLGNGLIYLEKQDLKIHSAGIEEGLPSLDITAVDYAAPYLICGTQGQGLLIVHENFFK